MLLQGCACYPGSETWPSAIVYYAGGIQRLYKTDGYDVHSTNVLRMLGYFGLVGLLRVHTLIGDYQARPDGNVPDAVCLV